MTYSTDKTYSTDNKRRAREETILKVYKDLFGASSLPLGKQYVTLCANHRDEGTGDLLDGSELGYVWKQAKFIACPSQFRGIDSSHAIIEGNKEISSLQHYKDTIWHQGTLSAVINTKLSRLEDWNPGVVYCDYTSFPKNEIEGTKSILRCCSNITNIVVVCNFVTRSRHVKPYQNDDEFLQHLDKEGLFEASNMNNFQLYETANKERVFIYPGKDNKHSKSEMKTIVFWK